MRNAKTFTAAAATGNFIVFTAGQFCTYKEGNSIVACRIRTIHGGSTDDPVLDCLVLENDHSVAIMASEVLANYLTDHDAKEGQFPLPQYSSKEEALASFDQGEQAVTVELEVKPAPAKTEGPTFVPPVQTEKPEVRNPQQEKEQQEPVVGIDQLIQDEVAFISARLQGMLKEATESNFKGVLTEWSPITGFAARIDQSLLRLQQADKDKEKRRCLTSLMLEIAAYNILSK